jgi:hypothetical protein
MLKDLLRKSTLEVMIFGDSDDVDPQVPYQSVKVVEPEYEIQNFLPLAENLERILGQPIKEANLMDSLLAE